MFPGQGSQSLGMGAALFDEFKPLTEKADEILGYSIRELCVDDPRQQLNKTEFTQPALFVVNALAYYKKISGGGAKPDFVAGHSLGEFNALLAAECFEFETGLRMVKRRGELMSRVTNGAMAAVLNASKDEIQQILKANGLENIDLANYNTPSQIVISGLADEIARAQPLFQTGNMLYYPLNTSGAFHSRFMHAVQEEFRQFLATCPLAEPKIPVIANVTARPYQPEGLQENLASQLASTVRWSETMQYLMALGVTQFEEVGHGDVLTRLIQTIKRQTQASVLDAIRNQLQPLATPPPATRALAGQTSSAPAPAAHAIGSMATGEPATEAPAKKLGSAAEKVAFWNKRYPIGTRVSSLIADYKDLETRTAAVVLFGHRAAVYMKGYNGYFDLDEIGPV
jgi:malonyl CoA-acyl carrier protein transacylase